MCLMIFSPPSPPPPHSNRPEGTPGLSGYVNWSLTTFTVDKLLDGDTFPAFSAQELQVYDTAGNILPEAESGGFFSSNDEYGVYLPFVDFECLSQATLNSGRQNNFGDYLLTLNGTSAGGVSGM